ncbi:MAG: ferrous iron transport protein A [Oscillospiraceae bacterium]|nr:ferrous iron transport protein A [Oscillospiraceae bacterium]
MSLNEVRENTDAIINELKGDARFISRITSIGLTPVCRVSIIKNDKNRPVLLYSRDTMIAVNRKECAGILVSEVKA